MGAVPVGSRLRAIVMTAVSAIGIWIRVGGDSRKRGRIDKSLSGNQCFGIENLPGRLHLAWKV